MKLHFKFEVFLILSHACCLVDGLGCTEGRAPTGAMWPLCDGPQEMFTVVTCVHIE